MMGDLYYWALKNIRIITDSCFVYNFVTGYCFYSDFLDISIF